MSSLASAVELSSQIGAMRTRVLELLSANAALGLDGLRFADALTSLQRVANELGAASSALERPR